MSKEQLHPIYILNQELTFCQRAVIFEEDHIKKAELELQIFQLGNAITTLSCINEKKNHLILVQVEKSLEIISKFRQRFNTDIFTDEGKQNKEDLSFLENTLKSFLCVPDKNAKSKSNGDGVNGSI